MAEEQGTSTATAEPPSGEGQAPEPSKGQEPAGGQQGQAPATGSTPTPPTPPSGGTTDDPEVLKAEAQRARQEAADYRTKLRDAEKKIDQHDKAKLSDLEKAQKAAAESDAKAATATTAARNALARAEVVTQAAKMKFRDAGIAFNEIRDRIEYDDEGQPTNVEQLLKDLDKRAPYLVDKGQPPSPGNPGQAGAAPPGETDEQRARRLFGGGPGLWESPEHAAAHGGGVVFPPGSSAE